MRLTNKLKKAMPKLIKLFEYDCQYYQTLKFKMWTNWVFLHVLGHYLEWSIKVNAKITGLCTKNSTSINKHNTKMYEDI